jgi:RNA polymerase sigma-70 factor (ECF subfamily)
VHPFDPNLGPTKRRIIDVPASDDTGAGGAPACTDEAHQRVALLYRDHGPALRRRLRGRVGDDADELLHDAFARLLGASPADGVRDPAAFLNRIVRNLLVDRFRRRSARPIHVAIDDQQGLGVAPEQGQSLEFEQARQRYKEAVQALPPRMRDVFVLHRLEGIGYKEIAARLDISIRTVEWHISEAIVRIGRGLDGE